VIEEAYRFNAPLLIGQTTARPHERSTLWVDSPAVVIDWVKKAEDSDGLIVRLYEAHGTHARARLSSTLPVRAAAVCNLLEDELAPAGWADGGLALELRPFQILTLRLDLT